MRLIDADELINTIDCLILHTVRVAFDKFGSSFADGVEDGYCRIRSEVLAMPTAEPKWIPCSEQLPEEGEVVLTQAKFKDDIKMAVSARVDFNYWTGWGTREINIVAWMPLPEPYGGDGQCD